MRCIKRAANRILTAGLALCLLLPCAAPAAAALETPDWMLVWSHTRTSNVIAQLEKDQFTAEITVDGVNGVVEMVRSNGKMYLKASKPDGTQVLTLLLREGAAYQLDDDTDALRDGVADDSSLAPYWLPGFTPYLSSSSCEASVPVPKDQPARESSRWM